MDQLLGHVDVPAPDEVVPPRTITVAGWVADPAGPPVAVLIGVGDRAWVEARTGIRRPDVENVHPSVRGAGESGWAAVIDLTGWDRDEARVRVVVLRASGEWHEFETVSLRVGGSALELPGGGIDTPADGAVLPRDVVLVGGWALQAGGSIARIDVHVNGILSGRARLGIPRPDIAVLSSEPDAPMCGFEHVLDLQEVPPGIERVTLGARAQSMDGESFEVPEVTVSLETAQASRAASVNAGPSPRHGRVSPGREIRLLAVGHFLGRGGASVWLLDLLGRLASDPDVRCSLLSTEDGPLRRDFEEAGIPVHVTTPLAGDEPSYEGRMEELRAWAGSDFNIVLANAVPSFPGVDLADRLGVPAVWAIHEPYDLRTFCLVYYGERSRDRTFRERVGRSFRSASTVTFVTDATRRLYERHVPESRSLTIPGGIDTEAVAGKPRRADRGRLGIPSDSTVVLALGSIEPRKGLVSLARAFRAVAERYPDALLALVGRRDDAYARGLREHAHRLGLDPRAMIEPPAADPRPWFGAADLFVCPSDAESLPLAVLEAMAFDVPVIATAVGGLADLIEDGRTGYLVEASDARALAEGLDRALKAEPGERASIGAAGGRMVRERHDSARSAEAYLRLLRSLVGGPAAD